jgi:hypothetical protein
MANVTLVVQNARHGGTYVTEDIEGQIVDQGISGDVAVDLGISSTITDDINVSGEISEDEFTG